MILKHLFINCSVKKLLVLPVVFISACMSPPEEFTYAFHNELEKPISLCGNPGSCLEVDSKQRTVGFLSTKGVGLFSVIICEKRIYFNELVKMAQPVRYDEEGVVIVIDKKLEDKVCSADYTPAKPD